MAVILKLLYRRRGRYYVEHFIFLLHQHTSSFLILTVAILAFRVDWLGRWPWLLVAYVAVMPLFAMKRYYGQGWFKTVVKFAAFSYLYVFMFLALFALGMFVTFLVF
jgi:hypothetical protein